MPASASPEPVRISWRGSPAVGWAHRWWSGQEVPGAALAAVALLPMEGLFRVATAAREQLYRRGVLSSCQPAIPVVSVGNLRLGGTGKTPVARWIAERLLEEGALPGIVHGGYAGDEPELFRAWLPNVPVVALRDRCAGVQHVRELGATVAVLDDAFQHLRVRRTLDVVLVSAERWNPRPRLLPRGPWREPPRALSRADVVLVTRRSAPTDDALGVATAVAELAPRAVIGRMRLHANGLRRVRPASATDSPTVPGGPVVLVSAIGDPESFLDGVQRTGLAVEEALFFPDHHAYSEVDGREIARRARGRPVVVTEKDAVKLLTLADPPELWVLTQAVVTEDGEEALIRRLREVVA